MKKKLKKLWIKVQYIKTTRFIKLFYKHHRKLVLIITTVCVALIIGMIIFLCFRKEVTISEVVSVVKKDPIIKSYNYTEFDVLIPQLEIYAPVIADVDGYNKNEYLTALKNGVVHFKTTAKPDEGGNVFIFGHSTDWQWVDGDYKTIFQKLPDLKEGETIILQYKLKKYYYKVLFSKITAYDDMTWIEQNEKNIVTLMTCYPIGSNAKRIIVRGSLYKITEL